MIPCISNGFHHAHTHTHGGGWVGPGCLTASHCEFAPPEYTGTRIFDKQKLNLAENEENTIDESEKEWEIEQRQLHWIV